MAGPGKVGRKLLLTEDLIRQACEILSMGNYIKTTCQYLGIDQATWYGWLADAELVLKRLELDPECLVTEQEQLKIEFLMSIQKATASSQIRNLSNVQQAADRSWQASAWILERRWPEMFSLVQRVQPVAEAQALNVDDVKRLLSGTKDQVLGPGTNSIDVEFEDVDDDPIDTASSTAVAVKE
jgi:transposase